MTESDHSLADLKLIQDGRKVIFPDGNEVVLTRRELQVLMARRAGNIEPNDVIKYISDKEREAGINLASDQNAMSNNTLFHYENSLARKIGREKIEYRRPGNRLEKGW